MTNTKQQYISASVIICGAVCLVRVIAHYLFQFSDWNNPAIPGSDSMAGLCYPVLFAWAGLLLRQWLPMPKWWVKLLITVICAYCLFRYFDWNAEYWYAAHLYIVMAGVGYLISPTDLSLENQKKGWSSLSLVLFSVFSFTAVAVIKRRLLWGDLMPEHTDMEQLLEALVRITEPLLCIISAWFIQHFSFSSIAQKIGAQKWFQIIAAIACVLSLIFAFRFCLFGLHRWNVMMAWVYYNPLLMLAVQPVNVYLYVVIYRRLFQRNDKNEKLSWKEAFTICPSLPWIKTNSN